MSENEKRPLRKDPEGRAVTEADNKTKKRIITVVCLAFAVFGILTNSVLYINSLKKAGVFLAKRPRI